MKNPAQELDIAIKAVCPIHGVSVGRWADRATWRIGFAPEATKEQRDAARAVMDAFDPDAPTPQEEREALDEAEQAQAKADAQIAAMLNMTPAEIGAAIDAAFPDQAQRVIVKRLARLALVAARRVMR